MSVPDVYVLDPEWFKKKNMVVDYALPDVVAPPEDAHTLPRMAHAIAALGSHYEPAKHLHKQGEWEDEVHIGISYCMDPTTGSSFQMGPVHTKTQYQFKSPYVARNVANFLNTVVDAGSLGDAFEVGAVRLFISPQCVSHLYCNSPAEKLKITQWWLGEDGAKQQLRSMLSDGTLRLRAGIFGGILYEGPLAGGNDTICNHVCVQVYPVGDMQNVFAPLRKVKEAAINDNTGPVDIDGQHIPLDGTHIAIAVDVGADHIFASDSEEGTRARNECIREKKNMLAQQRHAMDRIKVAEKRLLAKQKKKGNVKEVKTDAPKVLTPEEQRIKDDLQRKHDELMRKLAAEQKALEAARKARAAQEREDKARQGEKPYTVTYPQNGKQKEARQRTPEEQRQHDMHVDPAEKALRSMAFDDKQAKEHKNKLDRVAQIRKDAKRQLEKDVSAAHEAALHVVPPQPTLTL